MSKKSAKNKTKTVKTKQSAAQKLANRFTPLRIIVFLLVCAAVVGVCLGFKPQIEGALNKTTTSSTQQLDANGLTTYFVDVGQGDGIAIRFPDGKTMLVDAGTRSSADNLIKYLKNNFFKPNENTFDYLLLTHSDEDHCGGMVKICQEFTINKIFRPYIYSYNEQKGYDETNGADMSNKTTCGTDVYYRTINAFNAETSNIVFTDINVLNSTEKIQGPGYSIDFYYPTKNYITKNDVGSVGTIVNNYSPIMVLNYNGKRIMLTGDVATTAEALAMQSYNLPDIDVLKVAHHGSETSTSAEFLAKTKPEHAVISCGEGNSHGHPTSAALNRLTAAGSAIYRTDLNGNIVVNITTQPSANINIYFDTTSNSVYIRAEYIMSGIIVVAIYFCFGIKVKTKQQD